MNRVLRGVAMATMVVALAACGSDSEPVVAGDGTPTGAGGGTTAPGPAVSGNVIEAAGGVAELSTLVRAVDAAGLTATLSQAGDYTVLAPTNAAFDALYAELGVTEDALFANQALLADVLKYHVLASRVASTDIVFGKAVSGLNGSSLKFEGTSDPLPQIFDGRARQSRVLATDIDSANATVHTIDRVLLPADKNIVDYARSQNNLSFLVEAIEAAELVDTLSAAGPFTLLAPTNSAFDSLLGELLLNKQQLFENKALLTQVLSYHLIAGQQMRVDLPVGGEVTTAQGGVIAVLPNDPDFKPKFKDARNRETPLTDRYDLLTTNGVVHEIGAVLLPPAP